MNQLIRCVNCDAIFLKTPFDQYPEYDPDSTHSPESFRTIEKDDLQDFLKNHRGHRMEELKVLEDSFVSERDYIEPVKTSYFKATNGTEKFVIKKFREKIEEPLRYQLIHGDYCLKCIGIEIRSEEIAKQLQAEFKATPLPPDKLEAFLKLFHYIAKNTDVNKLERIPEESSNPLEIYYRIDDISLVYLLRNCRNIFQGQEYTAIEDFIRRHKDDGVLLLKATYRIQINEVAKKRKRLMAAQIRPERARVVAKG
ncbi:MAG: hypothetical protein HXY46_03685 [Syntrophaceae bacterium]|nr:hypothetical protein [Syntrophaceae bacterium]